jgi:hypothetical protein
MFSRSLLPDAFAHAFREIPPEEIWEWADEKVILVSEDAAESGLYRSAKTPWTRRLQELIKNPYTYMWDWGTQSYVRVEVEEINGMKCSQSGFSEACMNGVRWHAMFRPVNTIYAIDTAEEAKKIARRLLRSLQKLDDSIFTSDPDDIKTFEFLLRGMELLFYGSFSAGKFANKQAPLLIADEVEEHGQQTGDTSSLTNLASRNKTAANGVQINISKPKKERGPIHRAFLRGNQEEFFIKCPHCEKLQYLTFFRTEREIPFTDELVEIQDEQTGRVVHRAWKPLEPGKSRRIKTGRLRFDHCKNLLGEWDELRILRETYYECAYCEGKIEESQKESLVSGGFWLGTAIGTPGIISQHINDLYSTDRKVSWGRLALLYLTKKREGRKEMQGFYNHQLGLPFADEINKPKETHILSNIAGREGDGCPPYKRGTIPFSPIALILGSDIGGNYARWVLQAIMRDAESLAVIDWGEELDPSEIADVVNTGIWSGLDGKRYRVGYGFVDAKYRKSETYKACLAVTGRRLIPCAGIGGAAARGKQAWSYNQMQQFPKGFKLLTFNDRDAKDEQYIYRIIEKKRRTFFPIDVANDPRFVSELCAEEQIEDENGRTIWNPYPPANHFGDCVKLGTVGLGWLTRNQRTDRREEVQAASETVPV